MSTTPRPLTELGGVIPSSRYAELHAKHPYPKVFNELIEESEGMVALKQSDHYSGVSQVLLLSLGEGNDDPKNHITKYLRGERLQTVSIRRDAYSNSFTEVVALSVPAFKLRREPDSKTLVDVPNTKFVYDFQWACDTGEPMSYFEKAPEPMTQDFPYTRTYVWSWTPEPFIVTEKISYGSNTTLSYKRFDENMALERLERRFLKQKDEFFNIHLHIDQTIFEEHIKMPLSDNASSGNFYYQFPPRLVTDPERKKYIWDRLDPRKAASQFASKAVTRMYPGSGETLFDEPERERPGTPENQAKHQKTLLCIRCGSPSA